jgi:SIR2-like domain
MSALEDRPKLLVILGAGASGVCGIATTPELTTLARETMPRLMPEATEMSSRGHPAYIGMREAYAVGEVLWEALRGAYDSPDFETVLNTLESLESFGATYGVPHSRDVRRPALTPFVEVAYRYRRLIDPRVTAAARWDVTRAIHRKVGEQCDASGDTMAQQAREAQTAFFNRLASTFRLTVLSLNYDDLLERIGIDWRDGYVKTPFTFKWFDPKDFELALESQEHKLLHLHGSVRFSQPFSGEYLGHPKAQPIYGPVKYESPARAAEMFGQRAGGGIAYGGSLYDPMPVIAGLNKIGALEFNIRPFAYYLRSAARVIADATRILVIGYGGRDSHVNVWLEENARIHGDERRCAVILPMNGSTMATKPWEWSMISNLVGDSVQFTGEIYRAKEGATVANANFRIDLDFVPRAYDKAGEILAHLAS